MSSLEYRFSVIEKQYGELKLLDCKILIDCNGILLTHVASLKNSTAVLRNNLFKAWLIPQSSKLIFELLTFCYSAHWKAQ